MAYDIREGLVQAKEAQAKAEKLGLDTSSRVFSNMTAAYASTVPFDQPLNASILRAIAHRAKSVPLFLLEAHGMITIDPKMMGEKE